jgi:hypothetical protein
MAYEAYICNVINKERVPFQGQAYLTYHLQVGIPGVYHISLWCPVFMNFLGISRTLRWAVCSQWNTHLYIYPLYILSCFITVQEIHEADRLIFLTKHWIDFYL